MDDNLKNKYKADIDQHKIRHDCIEILREVKCLLDMHHVTFWLDQGTLLGAIRGNDFIPWDWDIDLSAWNVSFNPNQEVWQEFRRRGYYVFFLKKSMTVRLEKKDPTIRWRHVDIHFYNLCNDTAISYYSLFDEHLGQKYLFKVIKFFELLNELKIGPDYSIKKIYKYLQGNGSGTVSVNIPSLTSTYPRFIVTIASALSYIFPSDTLVLIKNLFFQLRIYLFADQFTLKTPSHYFVKLKETALLNDNYMVPHEVEGYLEFKYGKDWKIPNKGYKVDEDGSLNTD